MKRANVKQHATYDAAQARLRLLISLLEDEPADDDLESLDFTTAPEVEAGEESPQTGSLPAPEKG